MFTHIYIVFHCPIAAPPLVSSLPISVFAYEISLLLAIEKRKRKKRAREMRGLMVDGLLVFLLLLGSSGDLRSEAQQNSTLDPQEGIYYLFQLIISLFFPVSLFSF